jgi:hypothetical protein
VSYWATLIACFEEWAERHHQPHAVFTARRMAETADDIPNDLVMALFEIVEGEYDEQFDRDGRFVRRIPASGGYSTACVIRDLVARLTGEQK